MSLPAKALAPTIEVWYTPPNGRAVKVSDHTDTASATAAFDVLAAKGGTAGLVSVTRTDVSPATVAAQAEATAEVAAANAAAHSGTTGTTKAAA